MREGLWRILALGGAGCSGAALWTFVPDLKFTTSYPERDTTIPDDRTDAEERSRGQGRSQRRCQRDVVLECEAFMKGTYYEVLLERHRPIPLWAWVNPLAHAEQSEIERIASLSTSHSDVLAPLSYMAREVLLHTSKDHALQHIQDFTLIPLELELLCESVRCDWRTLIRRVLSDLSTAKQR
jgi:hypothetical protein